MNQIQCQILKTKNLKNVLIKMKMYTKNIKLKKINI